MLNFNKGNTLTFGKYYQENSTEKKPIKWTVLDSSDDKVLLLSKYVIDAKPYNNSLTDVTWEKCSLRAWLNGEFLADAFSIQENNLIVTTKISTQSFIYPFRVGGGIDIVFGGNDVNDKVFLLSFEEAREYFKKSYELDYLVSLVVPWASDKIVDNVAGAYPDLKCAPTNFAKSKNVYGSDKDGAWWWLRSPGNTSQMATSTMNGIILYHPGEKVNDSTLGIRPALWVKKEAFYIGK